MIEITVNSVDRTSDIRYESLRISDYINQQVNECVFESTKFKPELNQEISISYNSNKVFGGVIMQIDTERRGLQKTYSVTCKDYSQHLNRRLVSERFVDMTVNDIMQALVDEYATDFTIDNVDCDVVITQVAFNRETMGNVIQTLSDMTGFYWYVDYDKDIHFFSKESEAAPFSLYAAGGNHNWNSLKLTEDFSQIRNQVYVVGGEFESTSRTEKYIADGEQRQFPLAYKFKTITAVKKNSVELDVGIDGFDNDEDFEVFWNYSAKYIRFLETNYPAEGDLIEIIGTPLFPIFVKVPDTDSILEHGLYEFKIVDKKIASRDDAIARGAAELLAYANSVNEGSFVTVTEGLHSGQLININLDDLNEDFIIQSVRMSMIDPFNAQWSVTLATTRTLGIIQFLQKFLVKEDDVREGETLLELQQFEDFSEDSDNVTISTSSPPYVWGTMKWGFFTWS